MGMSASQARLLTLTARLSDLEYQAQTVENSRIRLAQQTEELAKEYTNALSKQSLSVFSGVNNTTGSYQYVDATAYNLTTYAAVSSLDKQRFLKDGSDKLIVTTGVGSAYDSAGGNLNTFLSNMGVVTDAGNSKYDAAKVTYYTNVFNQIKDNGYNSPGNENMYSADWLYSQLSAGNAHLEEWNETGGQDGKGAFEAVSWQSGDVSLQTKSDEAGIARAQADYEAKSAEIQSKDKKMELNLKQIDTEHSALQTEFDSVKKVIDKNIERSFKTFSA